MNEQVKREGKFNCEVCGKEVIVTRFDPARAYRFCGQKCNGIGRSGNKHPMWKDELDKDGYVMISKADHPHADCCGYVQQHILVAEAALCRYLPEGAVVHHVNGVKSDNRNENLAILPSNAYHSLIHMRLWRKKKYGDPNLKRCSACKVVLHSREFPLDPRRYEGIGRSCNNCFLGEPQNAHKTHCRHGHPFNEENTRIAKDGKRSCRICHKRSADATNHKINWMRMQTRIYFNQIGLGV